MPCFKNWIARHYSTLSSLEQQMTTSMVDDGAASGFVGAMGCGDLQSLSFSMSLGSQSSYVTAPRQISPTATECVAMETRKRVPKDLGRKGRNHTTANREASSIVNRIVNRIVASSAQALVSCSPKLKPVRPLLSLFMRTAKLPIGALACHYLCLYYFCFPLFCLIVIICVLFCDPCIFLFEDF